MGPTFLWAVLGGPLAKIRLAHFPGYTALNIMRCSLGGANANFQKSDFPASKMDHFHREMAMFGDLVLKIFPKF